jgi:membrane dipeptidase
VIASHSAVRSLANHSRNLDDEMLMAIKTNGGVAQIVAFASYVKTDPAERGPAIAALRQEYALPNGRGGGGGRAAGPASPPPCPLESASPAAGAGRGGRGGRGANAGLETLSADRRVEFERRLADIDRKWPAAPRATVKDFVDHIDYAVKLIGVDHVGISSDFDGGGGIDGWNSAAETFNVTLELVRRGYTEEQIGKIWSGNLLRVWSDVEKVAKEIQAGRR